MPPAAAANAIIELGADRCVLASDGGQAANSNGPEMPLAFAEALGAAEVPRASLRPVMCDNPACLLAA